MLHGMHPTPAASFHPHLLRTLRYVEPLMVNAAALQDHRKWAAGDKSAVDQAVLQDQVAAANATGNPDATAYRVALDHARPLMGYIAAVFRQRMQPSREPFVLTPEGFWFRNTMHRDVEHMLNTFKKDPQYVARQRQQMAGGQGYQHAPGGMSQLGYGGQYAYGSQPAGHAQAYHGPAAAAGGYSTGVAAFGSGYAMPAAAAMAGHGHPQPGMVAGYHQQAPAGGYPQPGGPANGAGMMGAGGGSGYGGGYQGPNMGAGQQQQQQLGGYPGPPAGHRR
jgi:hypothetical protein